MPAGWTPAQVGELIILNPRNDAHDCTLVGFVPMSRLGVDYRSPVSFESRPWSDIKQGYTHFADGDVLLAKITPCFENGKAGLVSDMPNGLGAGSTEYFVSRPKDGALDARYLLGFFKTERFLKEGALQMTGSVGHKRVPKEYLLEAEIPLAPLNEQIRIADKLDAVLARVDACRERLDRIPAILKRFRLSILAAATSGKLTEDWRAEQPARKQPQAESGNAVQDSAQVRYAFDATLDSAAPRPSYEESSLEGWREVRLSDVIVDMRNGLAPKPTETPPGSKILRISAVRPGKLDLDDHRYLVVTDRDAQLYALKKHDLLFTRYNGSLEFVGVCASLKADAEGYVYPDKLIRVRADETMVHSEFIEIAFGSQPVRHQIETFVKSSAGQKGISGADLKSTRFLLPPVPEQTEIVRRVESLFAYADRLEARYAAARAQVDKLTPATLAKAFRGELVPQDPNDEPAADLLARLRSKPQAAPKQGQDRPRQKQRKRETA